MPKFKIYYGPLDDFAMLPPALKLSIVFKNIAWSLILKRWGVEIWRTRRGELFLTTWGWNIGTKTERK